MKASLPAVVSLILISACHTTAQNRHVKEAEEPAETSELVILAPYQGHFRAPKVPGYATFAGDTVYFDRQDFIERLDRELLSFTNMHSNSTLMLKRSARYFAIILPILEEEGIPEDLKYLMAIESNLDPKALSVTGAAGLWQFTKATGSDYGLIVNAEVDERYNIVKETYAACSYLKKAYRKYGDWLTVAASYNAGTGGISKRLEEQKQKTALELWLPEETARYMFRLLACKMFFENPADFGFDIGEDEMYPLLQVKERVTVTGEVPSLVDFAISHGSTYAKIKEANLWLRSDRLTNKEGRTFTITVPR